MERTKEKFFGWGVLAGCLILMIFPGGLISFTSGLFMYPICQEFGFGTTAFALTSTISAAVNALTSAFVVGYLSKGNRKTMKIIMAAAVVISCGGFAGMSFCRELWQFYVVTGIYSLGYTLFTYTPVSMVLSNWFIKKREMLTGIAFAGASLGGAIFNTVISRFITTDGWRTGYKFGGILTLAFGLFAVIIFIKRSPAEYGQQAYGAGETEESGEGKVGTKVWMGIDQKTAMGQPVFYAMCLLTLMTGIYAAGIANHVVNYLCGAGWDITAAGMVMTVYTLAGIAGNSCGGSVLGRFGLKKGVLMGVCTLLVAMACLILAGKTPVFAYIFAVFMGLSTFVSVLLPSQMVAGTFGLKEYAGIYGVIYAFYLVGCAASSPIVAMVAEAAGYTLSWIMCMGIVLLIFAVYMYCIQAAKKIKEQYPD